MGTGLFQTPKPQGILFREKQRREAKTQAPLTKGQCRGLAAVRAKGQATRDRFLDLLASDEGEKLSATEIGRRIGIGPRHAAKIMESIRREMGE